MFGRSTYPEPVVISTYLGRTFIGWPDRPYGVQVSAYNPVYLSVEPQGSYRRLSAGQRGYIASTENPAKVQRVLKRYLRIAWRLNHDPEYAKDTPAIVADVLDREGIRPAS
jgi:hypothetical protein